MFKSLGVSDVSKGSVKVFRIPIIDEFIILGRKPFYGRF